MKTDWIVIDYSVSPAVFRCRRCGTVGPIPFGFSVDTVVTESKVFIRAHKRCKEKESGDE